MSIAWLRYSRELVKNSTLFMNLLHIELRIKNKKAENRSEEPFNTIAMTCSQREDRPKHFVSLYRRHLLVVPEPFHKVGKSLIQIKYPIQTQTILP
jgi:hypothetical protein